MSPHPRSVRNRKLPPGLRVRDGYFSWRHPETGKEFGLGRDRDKAIAEANEANIHIAGVAGHVRLVDRLSGQSDHSLGAWLDNYERLLASRKLKANTQRSNKSRLKLIRSKLDLSLAIERITTKMLADFLNGLRAEGKARTAQAMRSLLLDVFREAVADGWIETNPVLVTRNELVEVQRARLTLDVYLRARETATGWMANAMDLAIVSAQRREDVADAKFPDFHDDAWFCVQGKTGNRLCLPLSLRLAAVGLSLSDVLSRCRSTGVLSRFLIHQTRPRGNSKVGSQIWVDTITRHFSAAVEALGIDWEGKTPPTFHEIRSLSERLYAEQGNVNTQELLGHKDPRMTAVYHDSRGAEWVRVAVR